jgi:probable rRNA maturation factor
MPGDEHRSAHRIARNGAPRADEGSVPDIAVQNPSRSRRVPPAAQVVHWVRHALGPLPGRHAVQHAEITVRFVTQAEAVCLNARFRGRDYPPNVLSFPYAADAFVAAPAGVCGDIAICPAIVAREARTQGKPFAAHLAHLVVHGVLHLRGYDHVEDRAARRMERIESRLLSALGLDDPWAVERAQGATRAAGAPDAGRAAMPAGLPSSTA